MRAKYLGTGILIILLLIGGGIIFYIRQEWKTNTFNFKGTYIALQKCSENAQSVIKQNKFKLIHSCKEEVISFKDKKVPYIFIEYGPPRLDIVDPGFDPSYEVTEQDYSYNKKSFVFIDEKMFAVPEKPITWGKNHDTRQIYERYGCSLQVEFDPYFRSSTYFGNPIPLPQVELIEKEQRYTWQITYTNFEVPDSYGNKCRINGNEILNSNNSSNLNLVVSYPRLIDCEDRERCLIFVAGAKKDERVCNKIHSYENYVQCYTNVAQRILDEKICDKIKFPEQVNYCKDEVLRLKSIIQNK